MAASAISVLAASVLAAAGAPGEPAFDFETAMYDLDRISECLESFQLLTEELMGQTGVLYPSMIPEGTGALTVDPARLVEIGNTGWDLQHIGFLNFVRYVRATLESQRLRIMELELQVACLEGAGPAELDSMREALAGQELLVEEYSTTGWVD